MKAFLGIAGGRKPHWHTNRIQANSAHNEHLHLTPPFPSENPLQPQCTRTHRLWLILSIKQLKGILRHFSTWSLSTPFVCTAHVPHVRNSTRLPVVKKRKKEGQLQNSANKCFKSATTSPKLKTTPVTRVIITSLGKKNVRECLIQAVCSFQTLEQYME